MEIDMRWIPLRYYIHFMAYHHMRVWQDVLQLVTVVVVFGPELDQVNNLWKREYIGRCKNDEKWKRTYSCNITRAGYRIVLITQ